MNNIVEIKASARFNKSRKWKQTEFVVSTFRAITGDVKDLEKGLITTQKANFNYAEFTWTNQEICLKGLDICDKLGLKAIIQDTSLFGGFQDQIKGPESIDSIKEAISLFGSHKSLAGYYVWDEPLMEQLKASREQVDLFEELDPQRIPFTVAIPSYNLLYTWDNNEFSNYLDQYVKTINPIVLSLDYYPFFWEVKTSDQLDKSNLWKDIGYQRKLCLKYEIPMWFYIQSVGDVGTYEVAGITAEHIRVQAYNALMYGSVGVQYYNGVTAAVTQDGTEGELFHEIKEINGELLALGKTLLYLKSTFIYHGGNVNDPLVDDINSSEFLKELPDKISAGVFQDNSGNSYIMFLNRDYEEFCEKEIVLKKACKVYEVSKIDGGHVLISSDSKNLVLNLKPGEGSLYRLGNTNEPEKILRYVSTD